MRTVFKCALFVVLAINTVSSALGQRDGTPTSVTISNVEPRRDTDGVIMDIHDGNTFLHTDGLYYYFGASYGLCKEPAGNSGCAGAKAGACGFQFNHNVSLYTSPDMQTWTNRGHVLNMADTGLTGVLFCPKVVYNAAYKHWVMWFNWIEGADFSHSYYAALVAASPEGPYKLVNSNVTLKNPNTGDFSLFVDNNGDGYVIYTSFITGPAPTHRMSVEKLNADYLSSTMENSGVIGATFSEAPAMFRRGDVYYAVFGHCCCYCAEGGPVVAYTSLAPLGPYATRNFVTNAKIASQQTNIMMYSSPMGPQFLWQGDRWQSAPDHLKGHDFSYWGALNFTADGNITALPYEASFKIEIDVA